MKTPEIHESVFVAPTATVVGNVRIGARSSVFFGAVIRSELDEIVIGEGTNIQDNCVLHIERGIPVHVGSGCTIGHSAIVHSCTVGDNTLVGMGAIILNGAVVGKNCIIGAGALIPQNAVIPDGSLVVGMPARCAEASPRRRSPPTGPARKCTWRKRRNTRHSSPTHKKRRVAAAPRRLILAKAGCLCRSGGLSALCRGVAGLGA